MSDTRKLFRFDRTLFATAGTAFVGVDEAGRGPLAGPVVAAAVELDISKSIPGINDSKKVPAEKRAILYEKITQKALAWAVGVATSEEIDTINILQASLLAMKRALDALNRPWNLALIDGNKRIPSVAPELQQTVVDGDAKSASIAAASIIAKVTRDRMMDAFHEQFPHYEFNAHKGYATARHRELLHKHGLCPIHRTSFCSLYLQTELPLGL